MQAEQQSEREVITVASIRAAGGIVHSDGNIFFTNIDQLRAALSHPSTPQGWISVKDTMPKSGRTVLAYYLNQYGKERRVRAQWIAAKSHESSPDSDIGEYDEEADAYFDPEGWYECIDNWDDYSSVGICGVEVTHWMPLPPPPEQGGKG